MKWQREKKEVYNLNKYEIFYKKLFDYKLKMKELVYLYIFIFNLNNTIILEFINNNYDSINDVFNYDIENLVNIINFIENKFDDIKAKFFLNNN